MNTPASETSKSYGSWCSACEGGQFQVNLLNAPPTTTPPNGEYAGRIISETFTNVNDTCYFKGSKYQKITSVPPGSLGAVSPTNTYNDGIYNDPAWVQYYQGLIHSGAHGYTGNTCSETESQQISIQACSGSATTLYNTHTSGITIQSDQVTATRNGASMSGN